MHCPRELAGGEGCPRASLRGGVRCPRALAGVGMVGISISTSRHPLLPDCLTWSDRKLRWGGEEGRCLHPRHCGSTIVVHVTCIINTTKTILLLPYTLCLLPTLDARILRTNQSFGRSYAGPRRALPSLIRSFVHTSPSCLFSDPDYATVFLLPRFPQYTVSSSLQAGTRLRPLPRGAGGTRAFPLQPSPHPRPRPCGHGLGLGCA